MDTCIRWGDSRYIQPLRLWQLYPSGPGPKTTLFALSEKKKKPPKTPGKGSTMHTQGQNMVFGFGPLELQRSRYGGYTPNGHLRLLENGSHIYSRYFWWFRK